jgi:hypothetical protein
MARQPKGQVRVQIDLNKDRHRHKRDHQRLLHDLLALKAEDFIGAVERIILAVAGIGLALAIAELIEFISKG